MPSETPWLDDPDYLSPWLEPNYVVGPDVIYFGADPAWSPNHERSPSDGQRCPKCGSEGFEAFFIPAIGEPGEWLFFRGRIRHGENVACGACLRWGLDNLLTSRIIAEYGKRGSIDPVPRVPIED